MPASVSRIWIYDGTVAAQAGKRYLLLGLTLGVRLISTDTRTYTRLAYTQDGVLCTLSLFSVPSVAGAYIHSWVLPAEGILMDVNTALQIETDAGAAAHTIAIVFREVVN